MNQNVQNEKLIEIGIKVSQRLEKFENILVLIFIAGLILKVATASGISILLILSLLILGVLYSLTAYAPLDDDNAGGLENFISKLISMSCSITTIGILFALENWKGSQVFILLGSMTLIIILSVIFLLKSKKPELTLFKTRTILRIVIIAALGITLYYTPKADMIKLGLYKNVITETTN